MPNFDYEDALVGNIAGLDEVGRGCLAGPVVACALHLKSRDIPLDILSIINDSKLLSIKKRELIANSIIPYVNYEIVEVSVDKIDEINILQASLLAMQQAAIKLNSKVSLDNLIVDGNQKFKSDIKVHSIIQGDKKSYSIALASILAKVYRDNKMKELDKYFPQYNWRKNAGYGTKQHLEAIKQYGITEHHRKTFGIIKDYCNNAEDLGL